MSNQQRLLVALGVAGALAVCGFLLFPVAVPQDNIARAASTPPDSGAIAIGPQSHSESVAADGREKSASASLNADSGIDPKTVRDIAMQSRETVTPKSIKREKEGFIARYLDVSNDRILAMADGGNVEAAILASELIEACWSGAPLTTEPHCKASHPENMRRRLKMLLVVAKSNHQLDTRNLFLAAAELAKYGLDTETDRSLVSSTLDILHRVAASGNTSAFLALAQTYDAGLISRQNSAYAFLFTSIASQGSPKEAAGERSASLARELRPGDRLATVTYAKQFNANLLPPLYRW